MSLFHKNKKFPKYHKDSELPNLPKYESQMDQRDYAKPPSAPKFDMKDHELEEPSYSPLPDINKGLPELDLPIRRPGKFELGTPDVKEMVQERPPLQERVPERVFSQSVQGSGPIYVKLEDYKKAVKNIAIIRDRLEEAEDVLTDIMDLKKEEDQQLSDWQKELSEIKAKLLEVDKGLFEVGR